MASQLGLKLSDFPYLTAGENSNYPKKIDNAFIYTYSHTSYGVKYIKRNYQLSLNDLQDHIESFIGVSNVGADFRQELSLWSGDYYSDNKARSYVYEWKPSERNNLDYAPKKFANVENTIYFVNAAPIPMEEPVEDPYQFSFKVVDKNYVDERHNGKRVIKCTDSIVLRPYSAVYDFDTVPESINVDNSNIKNNNSLDWVIRFPNEQFTKIDINFTDGESIEVTEASFVENNSEYNIVVLKTAGNVTDQIVNVGNLALDEIYERLDSLDSSLEQETSERKAADSSIKSQLDDYVKKTDDKLKEVDSNIEDINNELETKASKDELNSLDTNLNESLSNLSGELHSEIDKKTDKTDFDSFKDETEGKLSDISNSLDTKADKEEVESKIQEIESNLEESSGEFDSKIEEVQQILENKANSSTVEELSGIIEQHTQNITEINQSLEQKANISDIPEVIEVLEHNDAEKATSSKAVEDWVNQQDFADSSKITEFSSRLDDLQGELENIDPNSNLPKLAEFLGSEEVSHANKNTLKDIKDAIDGFEATNLPVQQQLQSSEPESTYAVSSKAVIGGIEEHAEDNSLHLENNQGELIEAFFGDRQPEGSISEGESLDEIVESIKANATEIDSLDSRVDTIEDTLDDLDDFATIEYVENKFDGFSFSKESSIGYQEMLDANSHQKVYDSQTIGTWVDTYYAKKTDIPSGITLDDTVTSNSSNAVKSSGIYSYVNSKLNNVVTWDRVTSTFTDNGYLVPTKDAVIEYIEGYVTHLKLNFPWYATGSSNNVKSSILFTTKTATEESNAKADESNIAFFGNGQGLHGDANGIYVVNGSNYGTVSVNSSDGILVVHKGVFEGCNEQKGLMFINDCPGGTIEYVPDRKGLCLIQPTVTEYTTGDTQFQLYWPNKKEYAARISGYTQWKDDYNVFDKDGEEVVKNGKLTIKGVEDTGHVLGGQGSYSSIAVGDGSTSSGGESTAVGHGSIASGNCSTAIGEEACAEGRYSTSIGMCSAARADGSFAIGAYNEVENEGEGTLLVGNYNENQFTKLTLINAGTQASNNNLDGEAGLAYSVNNNNRVYKKLSDLFSDNIILLNSEDELPPANLQKKGILYLIPEEE